MNEQRASKKLFLTNNMMSEADIKWEKLKIDLAELLYYAKVLRCPDLFTRISRLLNTVSKNKPDKKRKKSIEKQIYQIRNELNFAKTQNSK